MALFFTRNSPARPTDVAAPPTGHPASTSPAGLRRYDDLHRRAVWGMLSDQARALELEKLPRREPSMPQDEASATSAKAPYNYRNDEAFQQWLTKLARQVFQPRAVSTISAWLAEAPHDAHLLVTGMPNSGRLSIVTTLARQAMATASAPPPPDYCYVPHPKALHQHERLELSAGTGTGFQKALAKALKLITEYAWPLTSADSSASMSQHSSGDIQAQLVDQVFADVRAVTPQEAKHYIDNLYQALEQALHSSDAPELAPVELFASPRCADSNGGSAPFVVALNALESVDTLLCARGGILILSAASLADGWKILRMALRMGRIDVSNHGGPPLPLPLRVIAISDNTALHPDVNQLRELADFDSLFRYHAYFEDSMEWNSGSEAAYAALAHEIAMLAQVPELEPGGVAYLIEEGARRLDGLNRTHLTTRITTLGDLIIETGQYVLDTQGGAQDGAALPPATSAHIHEVVQRRRRHLDSGRRAVLKGRLTDYAYVPTDGADFSVITGLDASDTPLEEQNVGGSFRLSVTVSPSEHETLIDVEREANAADESHIMGELTMIGYLTWRYIQRLPIEQQHPICLRARVRGEDEFEKAGGPSASAAMLFALLSALANVPIFRSFAVTGAVSQHGELQTIGGVNYKIEGFWELCKARWERGERPEHARGYGVLIPRANAQDLMLRPEIARSIANECWFAVYPISTIDEGLPILTGISADEIHARVRQTLDRFYELTSRGKA